MTKAAEPLYMSHRPQRAARTLDNPQGFGVENNLMKENQNLNNFAVPDGCFVHRLVLIALKQKRIEVVQQPTAPSSSLGLQAHVVSQNFPVNVSTLSICLL